jgi:aerobic-type carbon monoxide dehydrogenase small subunit (CoxS/CutS family)
VLRRRLVATLRTRFRVNGVLFDVDVHPSETLLEVLRKLGFKSVKHGCGTGNCGSCTVLVDGRSVASCIVLGVQVEGSSILTVEGLGDDGRLHPVQQAFVDAGAPQCGFCTPGMIMTAVAFLEVNRAPTRQEVREAISGNICRCSGYVKVVDAIMDAAERLRQRGSPDDKA